MSQELVLENHLESTKNLAWCLYLAHAASFLFSLGLLSFIPLFINYIKRQDAIGTFVHSHHNWQIRSFWWYLLWMLVGGILFMSIIGIMLGWLVWTGAWLWKAYRLLKGFVDLNDNKAMP